MLYNIGDIEEEEEEEEDVGVHDVSNPLGLK